MLRLLGICAAAITLQGCVYGVVTDAGTGTGIVSATVRVVSGNCSGTGCTPAPVVELTKEGGLFVFDAYGDTNGAANVKQLMPASGQEAIQLLVQKPGYLSRTIYHRPLYKETTKGEKSYFVSEVGAVHLCLIGSLDSDGDSICDEAEARYGTSATNSDTDGDNISDAAELFGSGGVDLKYFGANPKKKDLFIEADYYQGLQPQPAALDMVTKAFAQAPVSNPDGTTGIALHIDLNQQIATADADADLNPVWTDFDVIKNKYFAARRAKFFHYTLFARQYNGGGSSGISRGIPGHDFVVSLGTWSTPGGTVLQQAGTLMHEFGHNIGLRHGGSDNLNYKPNYLSIMNYSYQLNGLIFDGAGGRMDYSRLRIATVNEATLSEITAFAPLAPTTEADLAHYGVRKCGDILTGNASHHLDFNQNGVFDTAIGASADCDNLANSSYPASQNDWSVVIYDGAGTIGDSLLGASEVLGLRNFIREDLVEPCITEFELPRLH